MTERIDPRRIAILDGTADDVAKFVEQDFKIRSGLCPNDCGLMFEHDGLQECPKCGFVCNTKPEKGIAS